MSIWRYTAVAIGAEVRREASGEIAGETPASVRSALRRSGLQVLTLRPVQEPGSGGLLGRSERWRAHLRRRRILERAELYDGLATMLESGLPLVEALETVSKAIRSRRSRLRSLLVALREEVRAGAALGQAMRAQPSWFEPDEVAMIEAGQYGGNLLPVLKTLAEHEQRRGELSHRLATVLAYPAIVAVIGIGVLIFLSTKTLPDLIGILTDAGVAPPGLTLRVMAVGRALASAFWVVPLTLVIGAIVSVALKKYAARRGWQAPRSLESLRPLVLRRLALAGFATRLAQLLRSGVPVLEGLRVLAPTVGSPSLGKRIIAAAERVERGESLCAALDDGHWFDPEFRRLIEIGEASGELETLLERVGKRYERRARRLIDRLAALLEPAVILTLAALIGTVVMAAILPIVRLQEVL
ncbi:MAG: type II secretion system F family protein [Planctomycetota bacterium]